MKGVSFVFPGRPLPQVLTADDPSRPVRTWTRETSGSHRHSGLIGVLDVEDLLPTPSEDSEGGNGPEKDPTIDPPSVEDGFLG